jgi:dUTPase
MQQVRVMTPPPYYSVPPPYYTVQGESILYTKRDDRAVSPTPTANPNVYLLRSHSMFTLRPNGMMLLHTSLQPELPPDVVGHVSESVAGLRYIRVFHNVITSADNGKDIIVRVWNTGNRSILLERNDVLASIHFERLLAVNLVQAPESPALERQCDWNPPTPPGGNWRQTTPDWDALRYNLPLVRPARPWSIPAAPVPPPLAEERRSSLPPVGEISADGYLSLAANRGTSNALLAAERYQQLHQSPDTQQLYEPISPSSSHWTFEDDNESGVSPPSCISGITDRLIGAMPACIWPKQENEVTLQSTSRSWLHSRTPWNQASWHEDE